MNQKGTVAEVMATLNQSGYWVPGAQLDGKIDVTGLPGRLVIVGYDMIPPPIGPIPRYDVEFFVPNNVAVKAFKRAAPWWAFWR